MENIIVTGLKTMVLKMKKDCNVYKLSRVALPFIWHDPIKMPRKGPLS